MSRVEVSTVAYLPAEEVYDFLLDFPRYADYSKHLARVSQDGDGGPGTRYHLTFQWWKLSYTAHARVTGVDRPRAIDWTLTRDVDASGRWLLDPVPKQAPEDRETATKVRLVVDYDPDSVGRGTLDLPALVSLDWVVDRVVDLVIEEGERVVERIVRDLEGEPRDVELTVRTSAGGAIGQD